MEKLFRSSSLGGASFLKNYATPLCEGTHSMHLKLPFVRKNVLEKFGIGGHLKSGIQEWDVDL